MKNQQYEQQVDALIKHAAKIADGSVAYKKSKGKICQDDVWNKEYHLAMNQLKRERGLIGW